MDTFAAIVLLLSGTSCFLLVVLAGRRVHLSVLMRKRLEIEATWRPRVVAFVENGEPLPEVEPGEEHAVVVDLLAGYARMVRGDGRRRVIAQLGADGTIATEVAALGAWKSWRRAAAAHRLGDIGDEQAVGPLMNALGDDDRDVRTAAARSLGRLQCAEAVAPLLETVVDRAVPEALVRWSLLEIGKPALPHLRRLIEHPEPAQRAAAVQLSGLLGEASDEERIRARLVDTSAPVREQAALALGRLGGAGSIDALLNGLEDRVPAVRTAAASALGRLGDPQTLGPLLAHAQGDSFEPARASARALARIAPDLVRTLASSRGGHLREAADLASVS